MASSVKLMTLIKDGSALNLLKLRSSSTPMVSASALLAMNSSCNLTENNFGKNLRKLFLFLYFDCSLSLRTASGGSTVDSYSAEIALFIISPILKSIYFSERYEISKLIPQLPYITACKSIVLVLSFF